MRNAILPYILPFIAAFGWAGCQKSQAPAEESIAVSIPKERSVVHTQILKRGNFNHELISNGKVEALRSVELRFKSSEPIAEILKKNGDRVRQGEVIARLDPFKLRNQRDQAKDNLEQSRLSFQEVLIGQGYIVQDSTSIPSEVWALARVKSGYNQSVARYQLAEEELRNATLTAPFAGVIANLYAKPFNNASTSDLFCTVIDDGQLEVSFSILEGELPYVKRGDRVTVVPFSDKEQSSEGIVSQINPVVEKNGMVKVKALVKGSDALFEGMNVRISVLRTVPDKWVVPKEAVVLRSGRPVLFTLTKDSIALWNYVTTGLENLSQYTIESSENDLKTGDTVIVSGNINLAHEAIVSAQFNTEP